MGNRSDGHDFLYQVDNINAAAALVSKENTTEKLKLKQICVQDTNKVLGMIANKWRKNYDIPVESGSFGAKMEVHLINDGPITFVLNSKEK